MGDKIHYRFLVRGGTAAALAARNEIPLDRELVIETDTGKMKLGNGFDAWADLPYRTDRLMAVDIPFDAEGLWIESENVQGALVELAGEVAALADQGLFASHDSVTLVGGSQSVSAGPVDAIWVAPGFGTFRSLVASVAGVGSSGQTSIDMRRVSNDESVLSVVPSIPAGAWSSEAGTPAEMSPIAADFRAGEAFAFSVQSAGVGARGAAVSIGYILGVADPFWANVVALLHLDNTYDDIRGNVFSVVGSAGFGPGRFGAGLSLASGNSGLRSATGVPAFAFGDGDFTIEAWVSPDSMLPGSGTVISLFDVGAINGWQLLVTGDGVPRFYEYAGGGRYPLTASGVDLRGGGWKHLAVSRNNGVARLFIDGDARDTAPLTTNYGSQGLFLSIGHQGQGSARYPFRGVIDEVRLTKGVGRYESNFTVPEKPFPSG